MGMQVTSSASHNFSSKTAKLGLLLKIYSLSKLKISNFWSTAPGNHWGKNSTFLKSQLGFDAQRH